MEKTSKYKFGIWLWVLTIIINTAISLALILNWLHKQMSLEDYWNSYATYPFTTNPQHETGTYERCAKAIVAIDCFILLIMILSIPIVLISKPGKHKAKYWVFYLILGTLFFRFLAGSILLGNPTEDAYKYMDNGSEALWDNQQGYIAQYGNSITNQYKSWYSAFFIQYNDQIASLITNGLQFIFGFFCVYFYGMVENQAYHKVEEKQGV